MNSHLNVMGWSCALILALVAQSGAAQVAAPSERRLKTWLTQHADAAPFPELSAADPAALLSTPRGKALLGWARSAPAETPELTYTLYRVYKKTGERTAFQEKYFGRRQLLTQASLRAWFEPSDPGHLDRVNDLLWAICEETTWVLPAHEGPEWNVDLFNAETGALLADVVMLLSDRIPEEIRRRLYREVNRRIFVNFLEHYESDIFWWRRGTNNWTGVCSGSIGEAALVFEQDPKRQAKILSVVIGELNRYIERGFESDGGCVEGVGYWGYGLLHFVSFAEMLRAKTGGEVDLLAAPKLTDIARFPLAISLGINRFACFGDSGETAILAPCVAAPLARRTGARELLALAGDGESWRLGACLRNLLWWDGSAPSDGERTDLLLPASGLARLVGKASGAELVVAAKAGHNGESHNHNDVASFIVSVGGQTYLCDPGSGLYQRSYFDIHRYECIFVNSYGHGVPRIGGQLQQEGTAFRGTMIQPGEKSVQIRFETAYGLADLKSATRCLTVNQDGSLALADAFAFDGAGLEVEEAFMTWLDVSVEGAVARIHSETGTLELRAESGAFQVESLEEQSKANKKPNILKRITLVRPPAPAIEARFQMVYVPKG